MADLTDLANLDYLGRVNRAIDHVTRHLAEPLPLEELARVAGRPSAWWPGPAIEAWPAASG